MIVRDLVWRYAAMVDSASFRRVDNVLQGMLKANLIVHSIARGARALSDALDVGRQAAQYEDALKFFNAAGHSLSQLRKATRGLISDSELVRNMNVADTFGISSEQFANAVTIADAAAKKLGITQEYAIESIIKGMARGSVRWTDNVGIVIDGMQLMREMREKLGRDPTQAERRAEYIRRVLEQGNAKFQQSALELGAIQSDLYDRLDNRASNMRLAVGRLVDALAQMLGPTTLSVADKAARLVTVIAYNTTKMGGLAAAVLAAYAAFKLLMMSTMFAAFAGRVAHAATLGYALARSGTVVIRAWVGVRAAFRVLSSGLRLDLLPVIALMLAIIVIAEELFAFFDPDKMGFFEKFGQAWDDLYNRLDAQKTPPGWLGVLHDILKGGVTAVGTLSYELLGGKEDEAARDAELKNKIAGRRQREKTGEIANDDFWWWVENSKTAASRAKNKTERSALEKLVPSFDKELTRRTLAMPVTGQNVIEDRSWENYKPPPSVVVNQTNNMTTKVNESEVQRALGKATADALDAFKRKKE